MNEKDLYDYFIKYMPEYEKDKFLETIKNFTTAVQINSDEEFVNEAIEHILKEYPFLKNCIKKDNYTRP